MFKSLFRCIRKLFSRIKLKQRDKLQRVTDHGANIDIEEALAEELEIQRRSGRVLSSTASIAAALRQRPRRSMPVFSTHLGNDEHSKSSNPTIKAAVEEMQKLTSGYIGRRSESRMSAASPVTSAVSPAVSKGPLSSRMSSSNGSSCNIPESVPEDAEPEKETETKENASSATERASEGNFRRSSIFDMRSEWI